MTMTTEERLAALKARQAGRQPARTAAPPAPAPAPAETFLSTVTATRPVNQPPAVDVPSAQSFSDRLPVPAARPDETLRMNTSTVLSGPVTGGSTLTDAVPSSTYRPRPASGRPSNYKVPWERVSAGGAAVVSFVSMVVAMGPLFKGVDTNVLAGAGTAAPVDGESAVAGATAATDPVAPVVDIQVAPIDPAVGTVDPTGVQPDMSSTSVETVPASEPVVGESPATPAPEGQTPVTQPPATQASATQAPTTQAPATQPPSTQAQTPATQAPTSQAPATQAPTTQPPSTAAPTTQPPTTQPPTTATTAPPRSEGSG